MSVDLIKFAFVAGEIAPNYYGRSDLEKYDLALAQAENWFIDYHGGISTRPGTEFIDYIEDDTFDVKLFAFKFSSDIANTNLILFGNGYIRFLQDSAYVLEAARSITAITKANPGVVTVMSHGYNTGDWVRIFNVGGMVEVNSQGTFQVGSTTANTFQLKNPFGNNFDTTNATTYTSGGTVARIYTISSPYAPADLKDLRAHQIRDTLRLTHPSYAVRNLVRSAATSWALTEEDFDASLSRPTGLTISPQTTDANAFGVAFVVSAVDDDGKESIPSDHAFNRTTNKYTTLEGGMDVTWTAVTGAAYYKIYRTNLYSTQESVTRETALGFIGRADGTSFIDGGITPDFSHTPVRAANPFGNGVITKVNVTAQGTGHLPTVGITVSDAAGAGAILSGIVHTGAGATGPITGVVVLNGGEGYTGPSIISDGAGTGDTYTVEKTPASGNYPAVGAVFQQRQIYAASDNDPLNIWGSRPGAFSNFGFSQIQVADDSYEFTLDSEDVSAIRHLVPARGGLLVINGSGIWQITGGQGGAVTATSILADPQTSKGATNLPPIKIDADLLYAEAEGGNVQLLSYNDNAKVYGNIDMSILANHLITPALQLNNWCYAAEPFRTVWSARSDGVLLSFAIIKDQNVAAWARHKTKGLFKEAISIREDRVTTIYMVVQRLINGRWTKFIEKFSNRVYDDVEDAFSVDSGLRLTEIFPNATLQLSAALGAGVTATAGSGVFVSGDVGKVIRSGGGKMNITAFTSSTVVTVTIVRPVTNVIPETTTPVLALSGEWTMDAPVTVLRGLNHLEGETVQILADGNVVSSATVVGGKITLAQAATRASVGLKFTCVAQNLPLNVSGAVVENKRKRVTALAVRVKDTRGLKSGTSLTKLYEMKERSIELYGEPVPLISGIRHVLLEPVWDENGQTFLVQDNPLPATVLGYVMESEMGDDPD